MLFVFLGLPAAVLAALLTATVVTAGADRRRHDQALLRARGASQRQLIRLAAAEALVVGTIGSAVGLGAACLVGLAAFGSPSLGADPPTAIGWAAASAAAGLAIAAATVLAPAWRDLRDATVTAARAHVRRTRPPRWTRFGLDVAVLAASGVLFWLAGRGGYQIVLAPEGVPTISVSYWAFVAPALLWIGAALLVWRLADLLLGRGWPLVARALRPLAEVLVADRRAFAVTAAGAAGPGDRAVGAGGGLRGVHRDVQRHLPGPGRSRRPTHQRCRRHRHRTSGQRRAARRGHDNSPQYPGSGRSNRSSTVSPTSEPTCRTSTVSTRPASPLSPRCRTTTFTAAPPQQLMHKLAAQPDSVLVSAETVKDFQLLPGDTINLRLPGRAHPPTQPPSDSTTSGSSPNSPPPPRTASSSPTPATSPNTPAATPSGLSWSTPAAATPPQSPTGSTTAVGTTATVTDIAATRGTVGSSLTAVNLAGLTRIELGFGLVLAAASGALVLALGLTERRRSFVIAHALGATRRHLRSFVLAEAAILVACGLTAGAVLGAALVADAGQRAHRRLRPAADSAVDAMDLSRCHRRRAASSRSARCRPSRFASRDALR